MPLTPAHWKKSSRWLALLWEGVRHLLAGYAGAAALLALLHILHGQEFAPPTLRQQDYDADALLAVDQDRALFLLFWFSAFIPCMTAVMDDKRSNRRRWWLPIIAICVVSLPLGRYLLLLPFALALPIYLAVRSSRSPERRDSLIVNAHDACGCSIAVLVLGTILQLQLWWAAPTVDLLAYFMFASSCALWSFLHYERIRRGLFITDIDEVDQKNSTGRNEGALQTRSGLWRNPTGIGAGFSW